MALYDDYLRRKSHNSIKLRKSNGYPCVAADSKGKSLKDYQVHGNCYSKSKNLFGTSYINKTVTSNGITFTSNADGTVVANGTATGIATFPLGDIRKRELNIGNATQLTVSGGLSGAKGVVANLYDTTSGSWKFTGGTTSGADPITFDIADVKYDIVNCMIRIFTGQTCDNDVFKPRLEQNSTTPSDEWISHIPAPGNPIDVSCVGIKTANIIPYPFQISGEGSTLNGITISENNGIIDVNGTASVSTLIPIINSTSAQLTPGRYWLSGCPSGGDTSSFCLYCNVLKYSDDTSSSTLVASYNDIGAGVELNLSELDYDSIVIGVEIKDNVDTNHLKFKPMIQDYSDGQVIDYEPAAKYKIPIIVSGKNLLNFPKEFTWKSFATRTTNIPAGNYLLTWTSRTAGGNMSPLLRFNKNDITVYITEGDTYYHHISLTKPETTLYLYSNGYDAAASKDVTSTVCNLMLTPIDQNHSHTPSYEPYRGESQIINIYLDEPLRRAGYSDYIDFANHRVVRRVKRFDFNPDYSYTYDVQDNRHGVVIPNGMVTGEIRRSGISNRENNFTASNIGKHAMWLGLNYNKSIYWVGILDALNIYSADKTNDEMMEEFKSWLENNPTYVYYSGYNVPATTEPIDLPELPSFKRTTYYRVESEILPDNMIIKYVRR